MAGELEKLLYDGNILNRVDALELQYRNLKSGTLKVTVLDHITNDMGLQLAGEFRSGNGQEPGSGFTGMRMGYPAFSYSGGQWSLAGVSNDVLEFGVDYATGKAYAGGGAVILDVDGIKTYNGALFTGRWDQVGNLSLGADLSGPSTTAFKFFAVNTVYNGENMGAGDTMLGDNSPGMANMFWDASDGQVKFRGGQTAQGWISNDGTAYFAGGGIILSASAFTLEIIQNGGFETVYPYATGGTITTAGGKRIHTFTTNGTFAISVPGDFETLRVGGGAGGGWGFGGGGGGAGGYVYNAVETIAAGSYGVTIGSGGAGGPHANNQGADGGNTIFNGVTAAGGGGGAGSSLGPPDTCIGRDGASGGGGGGFDNLDKAGGNATGSQGQDGGSSISSGGPGNQHGGGGGGGSFAVGSNGANNGVGGAGGAGTSCSISGSPVYYGGGGGGGQGGGSGNGGAGGNGGGGAGGKYGVAGGTAGTNNTGGGGGGGCGPTGKGGGDGGSGIVIISYPDNNGAYIPDAWVITAGDGVVEGTATDQHDGLYAAKVTSGPTSNSKISQVCTTSALTAYQLSLWSRGDGTHDGRYAIYDVTHASYIIAATPTGNVSTTYTQLLTTFIPPAGCTSVRVELWCPTTNTGYAIFDDIHLIGQTIGNAFFGGQVEAGTLKLINAVNEISIDVTCGGNSNLAIPTEHVLVTYCGNTFSVLGHTHSYQPLDATLTSIAALGSAANRMIYTTGIDTWAEAIISTAGRALIDDNSASDQRTTLGLGDSATKNVGTVAGTVAAGDDGRFGGATGGGCPARAIMGV
jgi:hypothetical protein